MISELVKARNNSGMTQAEVAKLWGRKQSIIAKIETCERRIDIIEFILLAQIVNLDINKIINDINDKILKKADIFL